jgi:hypothetical protein
LLLASKVGVGQIAQVELPTWLQGPLAQSQQHPDTPVQALAYVIQPAILQQLVHVRRYAQCRLLLLASKVGVGQIAQVELPMWLQGPLAQSQQQPDTPVQALAYVGQTAISQQLVHVKRYALCRQLLLASKVGVGHIAQVELPMWWQELHARSQR